MTQTKALPVAAVRYPKMSEARLKMLYEPGHIYAAYSRYCDWIKLGFSSKIDERLEAIEKQYAEFAPFSLIGVTASTHRAEQQLHRAFAPFRQRRNGRTRELYPAVQPLVQSIKNLVSWREWKPMEGERWLALYRWARDAADNPANRVEAIISFERYYAERTQRLHAGAQRYNEARRTA